MLETVPGDENQNQNASKTSISDKECGTGLSETKNTSSGL